jgi:hypothetical protein
VSSSITVAIPTIPPRAAYLTRAIASVVEQTYQAAGISVAIDSDRRGAPHTRQRALDGVTTEWVAFLDDDDEFYPEHLETLYFEGLDVQADYIFSYYQVHGPDGRPNSADPLGAFGKAFDPLDPHQTTITTLVRTELAKTVGFHEPPPDALIHGERFGEDFQFTLGCVAAGARIHHVPERTWIWNHHGSNTSGQPGRW